MRDSPRPRHDRPWPGRDQGRLALDQEATVMAKRRLWVKRRTPRWAILLSWIVGAAVWLSIVQDLPDMSILNKPSSELTLDGPSAQAIRGELLIDGLFFVVVATVVAAFAMYLVRLIGRGVAWLKLRF